MADPWVWRDRSEEYKQVKLLQNEIFDLIERWTKSGRIKHPDAMMLSTAALLIGQVAKNQEEQGREFDATVRRICDLVIESEHETQERKNG